MKKRLIKIPIIFFVTLVVLVTSFILPSIPAQAVDTPEYWGVIVGITDYQSINDTHYGAENAREIYDIFGPAWGEDHTRMLTDSEARKADILDAIVWMADNADADDTVLFDFSGHGSSGGYICPYDSAAPYSSLISSAELVSAFQQVKANKIVIILDSCYSGAFRNALSGLDRVLLLATRPDEVGWETSILHNFVFTYYLLQAIEKYGDSDTNHDLELTAEEIFQYAGPLATDYEILNLFSSIQHPMLDDHYSGGLSLLAVFVFDINIDIPSNAGLFTLDSVSYPLLPGTHYVIPGAMHTITVPQIVDPGNGTRYVFTSWNDGETSLTRLISKGTYGVNYDTEQLLTIVSDVDGTQGAGWYKNNSIASFSVVSYIQTPDTRHIFTGWSGDYTGTSLIGSLVMESPKTITANWRHEYLLSINSAYGSLTGAGWYSDGSMANISLASNLIETSDTRHIFTGWSGDYTGGDTTLSLLMDSPKTVTADWRTEYLLTLKSEYGTAVGAGWYDEGETVNISIAPEQGFLVRHIFVGWSGDFTGTDSRAAMSMNSPKVIYAIWRADYNQLYILIGIFVFVTGAVVAIIAFVRRRRVVI
jgi:hypothetical protein